MPYGRFIGVATILITASILAQQYCITGLLALASLVMVAVIIHAESETGVTRIGGDYQPVKSSGTVVVPWDVDCFGNVIYKEIPRSWLPDEPEVKDDKQTV